MLFPWKCAGFGHGRAVFGKYNGIIQLWQNFPVSARNNEKKGVKVKTQKDKIM